MIRSKLADLQGQSSAGSRAVERIDAAAGAALDWNHNALQYKALTVLSRSGSP
jgi:hypothetical protein